MNLEKKAIRYIKVIVITLGVAFILPYALMYFHFFFIKWNTEDFREVYIGEGTIQSVGGLMTSSGYEIQFEKFDLNAEFNKSYKIQNVPKLDNDPYMKLRVLMDIEKFKSLKDKDSELLKSEIEISVENSKGENLLNVAAPMKDFKFAESPSNPEFPLDLYYFSEYKSSSVSHAFWRKGNFTVHLHFKPSKEKFSKGIKGMLLIRCGGSH